jgi:phosphoribosyl 1,2-cyclic phosphate phosphodiesterase
LDLLIIDALRYTPHTNHLNIDGAVEMVRRIAPRRTLLTHLTHEVPHHDETKLPEEIRFAFDGMKIEL